MEIGIPGPFDAQTGIERYPLKFKRWEDVPLRKIANEGYKIKIPV